MGYGTIIAPRRLILLGLFLAGLWLRCWGLSRGPGDAVLHPDEWAWRVIDGLSLAQPVSAGLFNQFFYSLAALGKGLLEGLTGSARLLTGDARFVAESVISPLMAGRMLAATAGALQIPLVYLLARRCFQSVGAGVLAAAMVALSPLLVTQGHFLSTAAPLGIMALLCLLATLEMAARPGAGIAMLCGLALGLTVTTEPLGAWALCYPAAALGLGLARRARPWSRLLLAWPAMFALGLAAGLILGCPGLVWPDDLPAFDFMAIFGPAQPSEGWLAHLAARATAALALLADVAGLEIVVLWLAAVALCLRRARPRELLAVAAPLPFLLAGLGSGSMPIENAVCPWLALTAIAAGWPLVLLCRLLPAYNAQVTAATVLGVLLGLPSLWLSLGVGYLFWQTDTYSAAKAWLASNKPHAAPLLAGKGCPQDVFVQAEPAAPPLDHARLIAQGGYLLWNLEAAGGDPPPAGLQKVAGFELSARWSPLDDQGPLRFPRGISPALEIYGPAPETAVSRPLALFRPSADVDSPYELIFTGNAAYGKLAQTILLRGNGWRQRILRGEALQDIAVHLRNMGADLAIVEVRQGLSFSHTVSVFPGQEAELILPADSWPPMAGGSYSLKVRLRRGANVLARLDWDPLLIGRRALENEDMETAARFLARAMARQPGSFDAGAMLAGALADQNRLDEAAQVLAALCDENGQPAAEMAELARQRPDAQWSRRLGRLTGYDPGLLEQALGLVYKIDGPPCQSGDQEAQFGGPGFSGALLRRPDGGHLKLWLDQPLPRGHLAATLRLSHNDAAPRQWLGNAELWGHGPEGSRLLAKTAITGAAAADPDGLRMPFFNQRIGSTLELRLSFRPENQPRLESLRVGIDLAGHLRGVLRWYNDAKGRLALAKGRHGEAVEAFEAALADDPEFKRAYIPLARALTDGGQTKRAAEITRGAETIFTAQPEALTQLLGLYQALQLPDDAARIEKALADLRPSLKRESRFEGGLTLLGYDLPRTEATPGGVLDVNYYWRIWSRPPTDYFIFVHLEGEGRIVNYDHLLDHGRVNMTDLGPGQVVREDYRLSIPADLKPGRYRLLVGLWDPRFTGKGAQVLDGQGAGGKDVVLATINIK